MPPLPQDYDLYLEAGKVKARGRINGDCLPAQGEASAVIQAALDAVSAHGGGEVRLAPGAYVLRSTLRVPPRATLSGSGRGSRLSAAADTELAALVLLDQAHGARVRDLALQGDAARSGSGLAIDATGDCTASGLFCTNFTEYGIWMRNNSFLSSLESCSVAGCARSGIFLENLREGPFGDYLPNRVANCTVYGGGTGIECSHAIVVNLVGCVVHQAQGAGFHLRDTSNSVLLSGCRTFQITGHAVLVENTHELNLTGNVFCWHTGHGIVVRKGYWGTITGNEVIDNGSHNFDCRNFTRTPAELPADLELFNGIDLEDAHGYTVQGNTIFNWGVAPKMRHGIRLDARCFKCVVADNSVNYYLEEVVRSEGRDCVLRDNVGHADTPHQGTHRIVQTFDRQRLRDFITLEQS